MAMRSWTGPVFAQEWRAAARDWRNYALRSALVSLLLFGLSAAWLGSLDGTGEPTFQQMAEIGRSFYAVTTLILLGLVGLAAPAAAAGAICLDKARGNLLLLFATDLTDAEIVLGKLAARLAPVLGLILGAAPVLSLATLLGGVDPAFPIGSALVCLACGVFGCTLALTLSVWGRKTHEVLLATYAFGIGWLLSAPIWMAVFPALPGWARPGWLPGYMSLFPYNPIFLALAPLGGTPAVGPIGLGAQARFCALGLLTSALLAAVAIWRIREVVVRQAGRGEAPRRASRRGPIGRLLPSPSLDANPVLWREWHRRRPSGWSLVIWGLFGALSTGFSLWAIVDALGGGGDMGAVIAGLQVSAGLLLLSVPAATSLAEERQRGSLDVLMTTPLSTRSIVLGKWWGSFRGVPPLAIGPVLITSALATRTGNAVGPTLIGALIVAYGAAITSLGLALATWLPRMGRAVGLTAGVYLAVLIGAVPLATLCFGDGPDEAGIGLAAASPLWGVGFSVSLFGGTAGMRRDVGEQSAWLVFWIVLYGLAAAGLLLATLATFDACLGRMNSRGQPVTRRPSASSPSPPAPGDSGGAPGRRPPRA